MHLKDGQGGSVSSCGNLGTESVSKVNAPRGTDDWFIDAKTTQNARDQKMEQKGQCYQEVPQERSRGGSILQKARNHPGNFQTKKLVYQEWHKAVPEDASVEPKFM